MKNILRRATAFSLAICMSVTLLFAGGVHTASAEATEFDVMLERLETLEQLAKEYHANNRNSDSADVLVLSYIRSATYNSSIWSIVAGTADENFISYVAQQSSDTAKLRSTGSLTLPNGDRTDFIHMFAVMNMTQRGSGDLGGWMGDTCELVADIQNETGELDALMAIAESRFRVSGRFGLEDWIADLDGSNLYKSKQSGETWAECLGRYFSATLTEKQRVGTFVGYNLGSTYTVATATKEQYRDIVSRKYSNSTALLQIKEFGLGKSPTSKYHNAACYVVADYMYDTVHAPVPDETSVYIDFASETLTVAAGIAVNAAEDFTGAEYADGSTIAPGTIFYAQGVRNVEAGSFIPSEVVTFTAPQRRNAPEVPQLTEATVNSLSFSSIEGVEYSIDGGKTWQNESTFAELTPYTQYSVICRYQATESEFASELSETCKVFTLLPEGVYADDRGIYLADDGNIRCMMVAAYQDGRMVSVHAAVLDNGVWSSPVPDDAGIDNVRVFTLDEHFLPLIEAYTVEPKLL